jgi:hypothetical protein
MRNSKCILHDNDTERQEVRVKKPGQDTLMNDLSLCPAYTGTCTTAYAWLVVTDWTTLAHCR